MYRIKLRFDFERKRKKKILRIIEYSTKISGKQKLIIIYLLSVQSKSPDSAPAKDLILYQLRQYYLSANKSQINSVCEMINSNWRLRKNEFNREPKYRIRKNSKNRVFINQDIYEIKIQNYMKLLSFRQKSVAFFLKKDAGKFWGITMTNNLQRPLETLLLSKVIIQAQIIY